MLCSQNYVPKCHTATEEAYVFIFHFVLIPKDKEPSSVGVIKLPQFIIFWSMLDIGFLFTQFT